MSNPYITAKHPFVVIGLGNPVLSDDSVGLIIVEELENRNSTKYPDAKFRLNYAGGLDLMEDMMDARRAIIIDAVITHNSPPGTCHEFKLDDLKGSHCTGHTNSHGLELDTVITMGSRLGYVMPEEIIILGIEGTEFEAFSETPTPDVSGQIENIIDMIEKKLEAWSNISTERRSLI